MKRTVGCAAFLAAAMALTPLRMTAQQGRMGRGMGMRMGLMAPARADSLRGPGPEGVLRLKDRLSLTDDQVKRLDQIRADAVKQRTQHMAQMQELRSKVMAGELKPEDARKQLQAQRDATAQWREQQGQRVRGVLNDTQKQKIADMRARARAFAMGRRSAMRGGRGGWMGGGRGGMMGGRGFARMGRGMGGRGGFGPGMGRGFGPGMGQGFGMRQGFGPGGGQGFGMRQGFGPGMRQGFGPAGAAPPDTVPSVGG
jgi:hypothetical protein